MTEELRIRCDGVGCDESHPKQHDQMNKLGFQFGRWLGWVYVNINRPDVMDREMRFCSFTCAVDYMMLRGNLTSLCSPMAWRNNR